MRVTLSSCMLMPSSYGRSLLLDNFADLLGSRVEVFLVVNVQVLLFASDHLLGDVRVGSLKAEDHRFVEGVFLVGLDDGCGKVIAAENTAEDVDEDSFDLGVFVKKLEGLGELLTLGAATDVQEVGGLTAVELDDVHRGHGESSTVDEAADVSTDMDVVQVKVFGVLLTGVILSLIFLSGEIFLTEQGVRVNRDLAVGSQDLVVFGEDEGVDLDKVAVALHKAFIDLGEHLHNLVGLGF